MSNKASKMLYTYGSIHPLPLVGVFTAEVSVGKTVLNEV